MFYQATSFNQVVCLWNWDSTALTDSTDVCAGGASCGSPSFPDCAYTDKATLTTNVAAYCADPTNK